jgi:aspartyl-tRNA(Asn)/glutamyl-tRNA(Gln) amidotransferase subunit B
MLKTDKDPEQLAQEMNLLQVSDTAEIEKTVRQVLDENPQAAADVKQGETKAIGFLTGQVMAKSQGKANPKLAQETIKKLLGL